MTFWIEDRLKSIEEAFTPNYYQAIDQVIKMIIKCFQNEHTLFVCGNGGSAADAQHITAEFVGKFLLDRKGLSAITLGVNPAILTAWTNDHEFETVFSRQLQALGKPGDLLWIISTSGKSPNIISALETAKKMGISTIGMVGNNGGITNHLVDYALFVENKHTPRIQEIHLLTYHYICEQVESYLFLDKE